MVILGIDPGTASMGYGIVRYEKDRFEPLCYGVLRTSKSKETAQRLKTLFEGINLLISKFSPEQVAVEALFFNSNTTTAISVGQARGVAILAAGLNEIPVFEYTPLQVKQCVAGYGKADKKQIQFMVRALLSLNVTPKPDDAADALAIAICHGHLYSSNRIMGEKAYD